MTIRKYGTEPAQVEVRDEDNDPETLRTARVRESLSSRTKRPEPDAEDGQQPERG